MFQTIYEVVRVAADLLVEVLMHLVMMVLLLFTARI